MPEVVKSGGDMHCSRTFHTSVVLPDGSVFIIGGQTYGLPFNEETARMTPEPYIPGDDKFEEHFPTTLSGCSIAGLYCFRMLRLLTAMMGSVQNAHVMYGGQITIVADTSIAGASLILYGTTTHTVNTDQRRVELDHQESGESTYTANIPNDPGIALPGYYMLFIIDGNGVPTIAKNVQVTL
ncbi:hypothetical protein BBP40_006533 [Aspergillus hancockii]|nr:hypothetical protein BBP40_006533 [Aspergillus hancockii]